MGISSGVSKVGFVENYGLNVDSKVYQTKLIKNFEMNVTSVL